MAKNELVIYKSSAGSGKTFTLVLEYLRLVLNKPSLYRSVLAITFTNKATAEMKSRIVTSLVSLSENKDENIRKLITGSTNIPEIEIASRASKVLDYILHDYSGFSVSTIDSFFSKLVRTLARELDLPLRFDLELNTDSVIKEITTMLLDDITENKWVRSWLRDYMFEKLDNDKGWKIDTDLQGFARQLFDEKYRKLFPVPNTKPEIDLINELRKIKSAFESKMAGYSREFITIISQFDLTPEDFYAGRRGLTGYIEKLGTRITTEAYTPTKGFVAGLDNPQAWAAKKSANYEKIIALAEQKLIPLASKIYNEYLENYPKYTAAVSVLATAYLAGIIGALDEKLKLFRDENNILMISDNNLFLSKAISGQDAPFIYEKSGNKFSHFMLDEFQDTSDLQWTNLLPLIENSIGSGNFSMIVGDAKQSIYRWRGGNMNLLLDGIQNDLRQYTTITRSEKLGTNYRSSEMLVNFNNIFFESAPTLPGFPAPALASQAYNTNDLFQQWNKGKTGEGYVKLRFFEDAKEKTDEESGEISEDNKWKLQSSKETFNTVKELISSDYQPGDIAILTRTNAEAKEITSYFMENGITRIISPESMQLNQAPKILFLIDILKYINDIENDVALSHIAYYWKVIVCEEKNIDLHAVFSTRRKDKLLLLPDNFKNRIIEFRKIPLYELLEELSGLFKLNQKPDAYIQRFLDLIIEYTNRNPPGLDEFLEWWDKNQDKETCSVIIPSNENAIRVMSIHKSKGLQYPVVLIPFADWTLSPKPNSLMYVESPVAPFDLTAAHPVYVNKILEKSIFSSAYEIEKNLTCIDNINLLYVAFTRAQDKLYVFSKQMKESKDPLFKSTGRLIIETILNNKEWSASFEQNNFEYLEHGTYNNNEIRSGRKEENPDTITSWVSVAWKERLKMAISRNKISVHDPEPPETIYGNLFHNAASEIFDEQDKLTVVEKYSSNSNTDLVERLTKDLDYFISISKKNGWFEKGFEILNEAEFLLEDGSVLRPDRLILKDNTAIVIDYKTGSEENFHVLQVDKYAEQLKKMGYKTVTMFLIYPGSKKYLEFKAA